MNGIEKAAKVVDDTITKSSYDEIFQRALKERPPEEILGRALVYAVKELTGSKEGGLNLEISDSGYGRTEMAISDDSGKNFFNIKFNMDSYRLQSWLSGCITSAVCSMEYKFDELKEVLKEIVPSK